MAKTHAAKFDFVTHLGVITRGRWQIDPIHNGQDRDLILFSPEPLDKSMGMVLMVDKTLRVTLGYYKYGAPTEGVTTEITHAYFKDLKSLRQWLLGAYQVDYTGR